MDIDETYDPETGIFTAKSPGEYLLSWTIVGPGFFEPIYISVLMKNVTPMSSSINRDFWDGGQTTNLVIVHLDGGDQVFVKMTIGGTLFSNLVGGVCSFSGYKLH